MASTTLGEDRAAIGEPGRPAPPRRLLLLDLAPPAGPDAEALARAHLDEGWTVDWVVRRDREATAPPGATIHGLLAPPPSVAPPPPARPSAPALPGLRRLVREALPAPLLSPLRRLLRGGGGGAPGGDAPGPGRDNRLAATRAERDALVALFLALGPQDLAVLSGAEPLHLELLLALVPHLGRDRPLPGTLRLHFAASPLLPVGKGELDLGTLAQRLASGCPFRTLVLVAEEPARRAALAAAIGLPVLPPDAPEDAASLRVEAFGPVALLVSALWGRVGSSAIFDAQTRHLIARGHLVVRLLVEHWPHLEPERSRRIGGFLSENFEAVRPHAHIVAERRDGARWLSRLMATPDFAGASVVRRVGLMLRDPAVAEPEALAWAGRHAAVAVVNHLPQLMLTEAITRAPIVLETHDVYSNLIAVHGVPDFVPRTRPDPEAERRDEAACWARVAACVTLTPEDHAVVAPAARHAVLARPYVARRAPSGRSWAEVVAQNGLPPALAAAEEFDILLWGGWHQGNVEGIHWFVEQVMRREPALRMARVVIAGRVAQGLDPARLAGIDVTIAGFVDRIEDLMARARLLVIPDTGGTGISIKAMEALAAGLPFAATAAGLRGIDLGGNGFVPAPDAAGLAADAAALLGSEEARRARAALGAALYERNFSAAAYAAAMDEALARAQPAPVPAAHPAATAAAAAHAPRLSAVVCTYDRYDVLPDALASLLAQTEPVEVIVVDNSPDAAAAEAFGRRYAGAPGLRYLLEPVPGLSNARNRGLAEARAPLVAFLDDDAIASPGWSAAVLRAFDAMGDGTAVVGGRVVPRWVTPRPEWLPDNLLTYLSIVDWGDRLRPLREGEWLAGCNLAFRRAAVLAAGGFDRNLGRTGSGASLMSNEESELIARIRAAGGAAAYAPEALVEHVIDPARLTQAWFRRRAAWQAVSDFASDRARAAEYGPRAAEHLRVLAAASATPRLGFYPPTRDPGVVNADVGAAYDLVMAMLHAGGVEPGGEGGTRQRVLGRLRAALLRHPRLHTLARRAWHAIRR
jgi:GT2 family glycosyltransferase